VELRQPEIKRKVRREVEEVAKRHGISKEALDAHREKMERVEKEKEEAEKESALVKAPSQTRSSKSSAPATTKSSKASK